MYSENLISIVENIDDKRYMISLSLNKENAIAIRKATSWMPEKTPLKVRALAIKSGYDSGTMPRCPNCDSHVSYDKVTQSKFNTFCSDKCSKDYGRLSRDAVIKLSDYDWLYDQRIVKQVSLENIGKSLGCSDMPVRKACTKLGVPAIRLNESSPEVKVKLNDSDWMFDQHVTQRKPLRQIADEIGSSSAVIGAKLAIHGIQANASNSYDRKISKDSKQEIELRDFVASLGVNVKANDRTILGGRELDIVVESHKTAIEFNGLNSHCHMWPKALHHGVVKEKHYHLKKTIDAAAKGYRLIHVFSDDWFFRKEIVKSLIEAKLGKSPIKIFGRKCSVGEPSVSDKLSFLRENHLQGKDRSSFALSLSHDGEMVAVMTFCKARYTKSAEWELSRFAVKKHHQIAGGFSKLLKHARKVVQGTIISYADRTYSDGGVYQKNGFVLDHTNPPSYSYTNDFMTRMHRSNFTKNKLSPNDPRPEWEIMLSKGYAQVFDCGTYAFVLK